MNIPQGEYTPETPEKQRARQAEIRTYRNNLVNNYLISLAKSVARRLKDGLERLGELNPFADDSCYENNTSQIEP